jgi:DnaK suppressor protein
MARPRPASTLIPARQTGLVERHQDALACRLPVLRAALEQQRGFRREQLALLDACGGTQEPSARANPADSRDQEAVEALREVDALVAAGARRALADIDLALLRMDTARYGLCRSCGARIPLVVLEAIPKTTLCLTCQPQSERSDDQLSPNASRSRQARVRRKVTSRQRQRRRRSEGSPDLRMD